MAAVEDRYGMARRRIDAVRVVEVIEVVTAEGAGSEADPVSLVSRYYALGGAFIAIEKESGSEA